jgi:hypothetical protein
MDLTEDAAGILAVKPQVLFPLSGRAATSAADGGRGAGSGLADLGRHRGRGGHAHGYPAAAPAHPSDRHRTGGIRHTGIALSTHTHGTT